MTLSAREDQGLAQPAHEGTCADPGPSLRAAPGKNSERAPAHHVFDLSMPVMDGWRFREEQRRLQDGELAGIPVVILSAFTDVERQAETLGAVDAIAKPIDFERLIRIVRQYYESADG